MAGVGALEQLSAELTGPVIGPQDAGYDQARTVFYGGLEHRRPAAIVRPADPAEVGRVVTLARQAGLELAVRSGGHSTAGHSTTDGGIVLDLANLRSLEVDVPGRTAWAGSGLTAGEYTKAVAADGLATGFGDTGAVGIGGITLGGGVGFLSRKFGLTIDDLLAADLVTADGELVRADAGSHPDLFWAIRGGGGNFGVVTRFQFRLHEVPTVVGGMLLLPATPEVIDSFVAEAAAAPEELSAIVNVMPAPPMPMIPAEQHGQLIVMGLLCYAGDPERGEQALAPFRALATPIADLLRPMPYPEVLLPVEAGYHPTAVSRNLFLDRFDRPVAETILDHLRESDASIRVSQLRMLGGAVARVPDDATAYQHRQRPITANVAAFYDGPQDRVVRQDWVDGFAAALLKDGDTSAYVNFVGDEGPARVRDAYPGTTWDRLVEVKRRYDPTNLFRLNQNIPPA